MSTQWQLVEVPIGLGEDGHGDPKILAPGKMMIAENVVVSHPGTYRKRFGMAALTSTILNAGAGLAAGAALPTVTTIASYKNNPALMTQNAIYEYSTGLTKSVYCDAIPPCMVEPRIRLGAASGQVTSPDTAIIGNYLCAVWGVAHAANNYVDIYYGVYDTGTGAPLVTPRLIATASATGSITNVRVATVGTKFIILYGDSAAHIYFRTLQTSPLGTIGVETSLVTDLNNLATRTLFDVASLSDRFVVAYQETTVANAIRVFSHDGTSQLQTVTLTDAPGGVLQCIGVGSTAGENTYIAYAITTGAVDSTARYAVVTTSTFVQSANTLALDVAAAQTADSIGVVRVSSTKSAFLISRNATVGLLKCIAGTTAGNDGLTRQIFNCAAATRPFTAGGRFYAGVTALTAGTDDKTLTIVDLNLDSTSTPVGMDPVAAIAPRYTSTVGFTLNACPKPSVVVSNSVAYFAGAMINSGDGRSVLDLCRLNFGTVQPRIARECGDGLAVSAGMPFMFDGSQASEYGFLTRPSIGSVAAGAAGAGQSAGAYGYCAVYSWTDARGQRHRSTPSTVATISPGAGVSVNVTVYTCSLTMKSDIDSLGAAIEVELYRTAANGSTYYRLYATTCPTGLLNVTTANSITYNDAASDASITSNPIIYSQGAGLPTGGVLASQSPPSAKLCHTHKNRVWLAGCDDARVLYFSRTIAQGEAPAFNDALTIRVDDDGDITALGSLDDKLIIFKRAAIYLLVGDGPNDLGQGSDYPSPQRVASDVGCIEPRSVVQMSQGLMFQSSRGIYLLDRSMQVNYIGSGVEAEIGTQGVYSAVLQDEQNQVRFTAPFGYTLVYDYLHGVWTRFNVLSNDVLYGAANVGGTYYAFASNAALLLNESKSTYLDNGTWVTATMRFGWLRMGATLSYKRVRTIGILAERLSSHDLTLTVQSNDVASSQVATFAAVAIDAFPTTFGNEQLSIRTTVQKVTSLRLTISDATPSGGPAVGTGQGFALQGLMFEVGMMDGIADLPVAQKG